MDPILFGHKHLGDLSRNYQCSADQAKADTILDPTGKDPDDLNLNNSVR